MQALDRECFSQRAPPLARTRLDRAPATTWRHHFTRIEGVRLHWVELGESTSKPPLVLLHGLTDCYRSWRELAPRLAVDRRVLIPDLPGHGLSGRPDASYALQWYARILTRWLRTAGVRRADVVGHSFGGGVAQMILLQRPMRIRRLALVASGGLGREVAMSLRLASVPHVVERLGQMLMGPCTRLAMGLTGNVFSAHEAARLGEINAQKGTARAFARTVRDVIDWRGQKRTFFECASELAVLPPMAVFWGDRDAVIPFAHAEALAKAVEGVRLTRFEGCGHYPHRERPDLFVSVLRDFLDSPVAATPAWAAQRGAP